ncbi:MAG TPA: ATP-binding cassette domain-containing protein [Chthoniobacterales bacterium]|nr:ATP-binding cassette domain-containing protein [Chthoniobacterales bacterium]
MPFSAQSVSKRWPDGAVGIADLSAEFLPGTLTALVGRNGSGKTTILRLLAGLLLPDSGSIKHPPGRIGFLFQRGSLWPHLTVREQLMLALRLVAKDPDAGAAADNTLAGMKLTAIARCYPSELSGGQQQLAEIARCLCLKPQVILLDEIASSLDPVAQEEIYRRVDGLRESGLTIVASTHDIPWARRASDVVIYVADGKVIRQGPPNEVMDDPADAMFSALRTPCSR